MSVFMMCEQAIGLVRGKRLILDSSQRSALETLDYERLINEHAQEEAITCVRHFAHVRDQLFRSEPWVFARKTVAPAQLSAPVPGWPYAYALPTDCLKVLSVLIIDGDRAWSLPEWEIVDGAIACRAPKAQVRYTAAITNTEYWEPAYAETFCAMLAAKITPAVVGEPNLVQGLEQQAELALQRAHRSGAIVPAVELPLLAYPWDDYRRGAYA